MNESPTVSGSGPDLPQEIEDELLEILDGPEEDREAGFERLCEQHREHAAAIRAYCEVEFDESRDNPSQIGPYKILEELGRGGMGIVYLGERREPVRMQVAIKVIKLGMDSKEVLARFDLERRALAAMQHECIAKVHDAGTTSRGQPYFVMELVEGLPITDYCNKHRLSLKARLKVFQEVCQGVQHAHQKGVVHRDLKPGNILVARSGDRAVPKIIDFGLARATNRNLLAQSLHTPTDHFIGTPEYMAPEQASLDAEKTDTRADVYSLGVILYELLAGELPFGQQRLRRGGWFEIRRILAEEEPSKPSTKISRHGPDLDHRASRLRMSPAALFRELRGDLDWIILRAMAKEPELRYDSPPALAADLQRYLDHEPVLAGPPSSIYRAKKFLRKYRGRVVATALVLVTALVGFEVSWSFATEVEKRNQEFDMLADVVHLQTAKSAEGDLYPAWPEIVPALRRWLDGDAKTVKASLPSLHATVSKLEARASAKAGAGGESGLRFAKESERFLHDTLKGLIGEIESFEATEVRNVEEGLAWANSIEALSLDHPQAPATWEEARESILAADGEAASKLYKQDLPLDLPPQLGLVPLGVNPSTGLWEFYHLRSAQDPQQIPVPDEEGRLPMRKGMGMVFVLIPGGHFEMGAQSDDPDRPGYDERARPEEAPPHRVPLSPFFLSKFELTKGQWQRLSGGQQPSMHKAGTNDRGLAISSTNPVEQVSWTACRDLMHRQGLVLPTEAQWEYACRAGTVTPWSTGSTPRSLKGYANILDQAARTVVTAADWPGEIWFMDRYWLHAPVGHFLPNPWGLYDMHGNVWEWCRDWHSLYDAASSRPGDGLREVAAGTLGVRVYRGGGFLNTASKARSSNRGGIPPNQTLGNLGLRPARAIMR